MLRGQRLSVCLGVAGIGWLTTRADPLGVGHEEDLIPVVTLPTVGRRGYAVARRDQAAERDEGAIGHDPRVGDVQRQRTVEDLELQGQRLAVLGRRRDVGPIPVRLIHEPGDFAVGPEEELFDDRVPGEQPDLVCLVPVRPFDPTHLLELAALVGRPRARRVEERDVARVVQVLPGPRAGDPGLDQAVEERRDLRGRRWRNRGRGSRRLHDRRRRGAHASLIAEDAEAQGADGDEHDRGGADPGHEGHGVVHQEGPRREGPHLTLLMRLLEGVAEESIGVVGPCLLPLHPLRDPSFDVA